MPRRRDQVKPWLRADTVRPSGLKAPHHQSNCRMLFVGVVGWYFFVRSQTSPVQPHTLPRLLRTTLIPKSWPPYAVGPPHVSLQSSSDRAAGFLTRQYKTRPTVFTGDLPFAVDQPRAASDRIPPRFRRRGPFPLRVSSRLAATVGHRPAADVRPLNKAATKRLVTNEEMGQPRGSSPLADLIGREIWRQRWIA